MAGVTSTEPSPLSDEGGSPRPPTRVPGVWSQMPVAVRVLLVALLLVAAGGIAVLTRFSSGSSADLAGGTIIQLIPADGSNILQQDQIGIILATGYTTKLSVNGTSIPQSQIHTVAFQDQTQFTFEPGPGKAFSNWPAGKSCVLATYWRLSAGPNHSSVQQWCFTVV